MTTLNLGDLQPGETISGTFQYDVKSTDFLNSPVTFDLAATGTCNGEVQNASAVAEIPVTTVTGGGGSLITTDATRLTLAGNYEQFFYDHVDAQNNRMQTVWANSFSSQGTPTANEAYFWMTFYQNMARALMLANDLGRTTHVAKYRDLLVAAVQDMGPRLMDGADAPNNNETSKFRNNGSRIPTETRYAYLSLTRGLAWMGYVIYILKNQGVLTAAENTFMDNLQPRFKIAMDWIQTTLESSGLCDWDHGGFPHMPSHMISGMLWLEENGGYVFPDAREFLSYTVTQVGSNVKVSANGNTRNGIRGEVGSDISHDRDSVSNFLTWRDWQMLSGEAITVTDAFLMNVGNYEAGQINNNGPCTGSLCQSLPDGWIAEHALTCGRSAAIANFHEEPNLTNYRSMSAPTAGDSTIDSINQMQTVVSAAWGYGNKQDGE